MSKLNKEQRSAIQVLAAKKAWKTRRKNGEVAKPKPVPLSAAEANKARAVKMKARWRKWRAEKRKKEQEVMKQGKVQESIQKQARLTKKEVAAIPSFSPPAGGLFQVVTLGLSQEIYTENQVKEMGYLAVSLQNDHGSFRLVKDSVGQFIRQRDAVKALAPLAASAEEQRVS